MPAFNSITVNDRESTPVAHTFTPRSNRNGVALFAETTGVPVGDKRFTVSLRESRDKYKSRLVLSVPIVVTETINGVASPVVARTGFASVEFTFDRQSTLQERKNVVGLMANALAASVTTVDSVVTGLEDLY